MRLPVVDHAEIAAPGDVVAPERMRALLAPGDLPRGEALVLAGRLAARMIGAVIVLLVLAGLIEG